MDVIAAVKFYVNRMVEEVGVGMKVLLMDKETVSHIVVCHLLIKYVCHLLIEYVYNLLIEYVYHRQALLAWYLHSQKCCRRKYIFSNELILVMLVIQ